MLSVAAGRALLLLSVCAAVGGLAACSGSDAGTSGDLGDDGGGSTRGSGDDDDGGATVGDDGGPVTPDAGGGGDDGGSMLTTCDPTGTSRAVVVAVQGASSGVRVLQQTGGKLVDHGFTFTGGIDVPEAVAMREDGAEAIVAWGGYGSPYGFGTVTFAPDGSSAALGKVKQLGTDMTPTGITYVSKDRAVMALISANKFQMVTLDRQPTGGFAETTRVAAPGNFPLFVLRRPGQPQAILPRAEFGVDSVTHVNLLSAGDGGAYVSSGAVGSVGPPSVGLAVHPNGNVAYSPTDNPNDPVTAQHLTTTGFLQVLQIGANGVTDGPKADMPRNGGLVAVDPGGRFVVGQGNIYDIDPKSGNPSVHNYVLMTMPLDASGMPGTALPESDPFPALMLNDIQVSATGHVIDDLEMFPGTVPDAQAHPLEVRAQTAPGKWVVCQTLQMPGSVHLAIAP